MGIEIEQQRSIKGEVKTIMVPLGEKRADTMLAGIEASKIRPLDRVLAAMNIKHVGSSTAEVIAEHFGDMAKIAEASEEALIEVDGVGPELATSIQHFFHTGAGRKTWQARRCAEVAPGDAPPIELRSATP